MRDDNRDGRKQAAAHPDPVGAGGSLAGNAAAGRAREDILRAHIAKLPPALGTVDVNALALATDGLTGADIKRRMEDGKILFAYDRAQNAPMRPATDYFLQAIETVRANKARYAQAEAQTNSNPFAPFESLVMSNMSAMAGEE